MGSIPNGSKLILKTKYGNKSVVLSLNVSIHTTKGLELRIMSKTHLPNDKQKHNMFNEDISEPTSSLQVQIKSIKSQG